MLAMRQLQILFGSDMRKLMIRYGWIYTYWIFNFLKLDELHMNYLLRITYVHLSHVDMLSVGALLFFLISKSMIILYIVVNSVQVVLLYIHPSNDICRAMVS